MDFILQYLRQLARCNRRISGVNAALSSNFLKSWAIKIASGFSGSNFIVSVANRYQAHLGDGRPEDSDA